MNITFNSIDIKGFRSLGECTLDLKANGFVSIKGINNYEENTSSNGSGKSSIMEAMNWCLFGKTSSGIADVLNKYSKTPCKVVLDFMIDNTSYQIIRMIGYPKQESSVQLFQGDKDISCRNKSDTDKLIRSIIPFSQDIFLSTIFLSQGFSGRMSLLSPSARKERLEILANIDEEVNKFKDQISEKQAELTAKSSELEKKISYTNGEITVYTNEKELIEISLEQIKGFSEDDLKVPVEVLETKLKKLDPLIKDTQDKINKTIINIEKLKAASSNFEKQHSDLENKKDEYMKKLSVVKKCYCPTCNQEIKDKNTSDTLTKDYKNILRNCEEEEVNLIQKESEFASALANQKEILTSYKEKKTSLESMYNKLSTTVDTYYKNKELYESTQKDAKKLKEYQEKIAKATVIVQELTSENSKYLTKIDVAKHIQQMITKDFRAYLLTDIVGFMNNKLSEYSRVLFSNDTDLIHISTDSSKLDIFLGDTQYESLSGGEKKKIDLALVLAQRDIALQVSGFSCNIIIFDEILENLDEQASNVALTLLNSVSEEIESLYIISHNNYSIPVDSTITVTKNKDQISSVNIV